MDFHINRALHGLHTVVILHHHGAAASPAITRRADELAGRAVAVIKRATDLTARCAWSELSNLVIERLIALARATRAAIAHGRVRCTGVSARRSAPGARGSVPRRRQGDCI